MEDNNTPKKNKLTVNEKLSWIDKISGVYPSVKSYLRSSSFDTIILMRYFNRNNSFTIRHINNINKMYNNIMQKCEIDSTYAILEYTENFYDLNKNISSQLNNNIIPINSKLNNESGHKHEYTLAKANLENSINLIEKGDLINPRFFNTIKNILPFIDESIKETYSTELERLVNAYNSIAERVKEKR